MTMVPHFFIEQVAICPPDRERALDLLHALGMTEWVHDTVLARGRVMHSDGTLDSEVYSNSARLAFNYQSTRNVAPSNVAQTVEDVKPLELEVLTYDAGPNWCQHFAPSVSHLGMHCTADELEQFVRVLASHGVGIAQKVNTIAHANPAIAGKRWYSYTVFNTRPILGVDLKFIVRLAEPA